VYLDAIVKDKKADRPMDRVVPVRNSVDNGFAQGLFRQFRLRLRLEPPDFMWNPKMNIEETLGLIYHIQEAACQIFPVRRLGRGILPGESRRVDLREGKMPLRVSTEQNNPSDRRVDPREESPISEKAYPARHQVRLASRFEIPVEGIQIKIRNA
jgi:hypothetical protein